jgi:hypothetical protein
MPLLQPIVGLDDRRFEGFPDVVGNNLLAGEIRMHGVVLIELRLPGNAVAEETASANAFAFRD